MTNEKIKEVTALYRTRLGWAAVESWSDSPAPTRTRHVRWMLDEIDAFVDEGRREKAFRWLGFVQGALWCLDEYTIDELKLHNAPPDEVK